MINYSFGRADIKKRAWSITIADWYISIIIAVVSLALSIYFLCVGFLSDKEALIMGFPLVFLFAFTIIMLCLAYKKLEKQMNAFYDKNAINGMIDYEIMKQGDIFYIYCTQNKEVAEFSKADIKYKRSVGKFIVVKLKDKRIMCLPKMEEIILLLK